MDNNQKLDLILEKVKLIDEVEKNVSKTRAELKSFKEETNQRLDKIEKRLR